MSIEESLHRYDELEKGIVINQHALNDEHEKQPQLFQRVAKQCALAISYRDEARHKIKMTEATLSLRFRKEASDNREKLTEANLEALIHNSTQYQKVYQDYLAWKAVSDQWEALQEAYSQRSYALAHLQELALRSYYADVPAPRHVADRIVQSVKEEQTRHRQERQRGDN